MPNKKAFLLKWNYGDYPLAILRFPQEAVNFHFHEFMELVVIESGRGIHFTETESYPVAAGDVFVIREHDAHGYSNTNNLRLINVLFYPRELVLPLQELEKLSGYRALFELRRSSRKISTLKSRLRIDLEKLTYAKGLIDSLKQELNDRKNGFSFMAKALFMQLVCHLSRCYENRQILTRQPLERISQAITFMEANYMKRIFLAELSSLTHMSLSKFYRDFKSATGFSPKNYLIRLRVMHAADLLRRGELNATETAFQTGFNDSNYFCRVFHMVMGITPTAFRKIQPAVTAILPVR